MPLPEENKTSTEWFSEEELGSENSNPIVVMEETLGDRVRLGITEVINLKTIVDKEINSPIPTTREYTLHFNRAIPGLKISPTHRKLQDIKVNVEEIAGRILVKVGPCDLSGVGGHQIREEIIKSVVNEALKKDGKMNVNYENVNVSACVGVRGRLQMIKGVFINNREDAGLHMNAYVKTAEEKTLTHWEPRKGPQSFFNDTICAMVSSLCTSLFEKGIRENTITSSAKATKDILKSSALKSAFDELLRTSKDRIQRLVDCAKSMQLQHQSQLKSTLAKMKAKDLSADEISVAKDKIP